MTDDEIFRQYHQLSGHEFEQTPGDSEGQGGPCMLQSMGSRRVTHHLVSEQLTTTIYISKGTRLGYQRRQWQPTPVLSPGESQGWGSLVGCHLWGCTELNMTEMTQQQQQCIYRRRQWHPTPVLLPGKSHGWRSLVGCSPWGRTESDMTEVTQQQQQQNVQSNLYKNKVPAV